MNEFVSTSLDAVRLMLSGLPIVLLLTFVSFFPALALGMIGGLLATSRFAILRFLVNLYVYIFRSTPFLMAIFLIYYGLPALNIHIGEMTTAVIALSALHGAYMTEIIRGGLNALDKGQNEAAIALGYSLFQRLRDIILPQTLMAIIPSLLGQSILIIKDTSLVSVIGISEITKIGREVVIRTNEPFIIFTLLALLYFVICFALQIVAKKLEMRARLILQGR